MNVLFVTPCYEGAWAYGGIARVTGLLARGLVDRGHSVTVCTTDAGTEGARLGAPGDTGGVDLRVFANVSNTAAYHLQAYTPVGLGRFLRRVTRGFDIAHLHGCRHWPGVVAAQVLSRAGVRYVIEPHGTAPRIERRRAQKWLFDRTLGRGVMTHASRLIAVTEAEQRALGGQGLPVTIVPNPVELPPAALRRGAFRARWGVPSGELVVYLGKLTPRKRVELLVRAFAMLARPGARLVIAGNDMGSGAAVAQLVAALGIGDRVHRVGLLQGEERFQALVDADLVVYPGEHEVFGLVAVEAILCGAPVVVAGDSGCGETVRELGGGLVVEGGDPASYARAMASVLDSPVTMHDQVASAAALARARYAPGVAAARLEAVYREVLGATAPKGGFGCSLSTPV